MPAREHQHLIEQIADSFNSGALDAIDELVSPSLAGFTRDLATLRAAFPDARFTIDDMVGEGDKLADRYTISGTHARPFLGIPGHRAPDPPRRDQHRLDTRRQDRRTLGRHRPARSPPATRRPAGQPPR